MEANNEPGSNIFHLNPSLVRKPHSSERFPSTGISAAIVDIKELIAKKSSGNIALATSQNLDLAVKLAADKSAIWNTYIEKYNFLIRALSTKETLSQLPPQAIRDIKWLLHGVESIWDSSTTSDEQRNTLYANMLHLLARLEEMKNSGSV